MSQAKSRGGRPSRGDRHPAKVRFPRSQYEAYLSEASRRGISLSEYIVEVCAIAHGFDPPQYIPRSEQEQLAISA